MNEQQSTESYFNILFSLSPALEARCLLNCDRAKTETMSVLPYDNAGVHVPCSCTTNYRTEMPCQACGMGYGAFEVGFVRSLYNNVQYHHKLGTTRRPTYQAFFLIQCMPDSINKFLGAAAIVIDKNTLQYCIMIASSKGQPPTME